MNTDKKSVTLPEYIIWESIEVITVNEPPCDNNQPVCETVERVNSGGRTI